MNRTSNWQLALDVAATLSLPVFPCREKDTEYVKNGEQRKINAKAPYTRNGFKDATTDLETIDRLWQRYPHAMVGVPMGQASGLIAVDIDEGNGKSGEATFAALKLDDPLTVQTRTLSGGRHLFFKCSKALEIRNDTSTVFGRDIDVRGEGGYVIWAGSRAAEGGYEYIPGYTPDDVSFAQLPENFLKCFTSKTKGISDNYGREGTRNNDLFLASVKNVHAGMENARVTQTALALNQEFTPPLPIEEVQALTSSATRYRSSSYFPYTDLGNAERFRRDHLGSVIYVPEMKNWLCYADGVWKPDRASVNQRMHITVRNIINEGGGSIEAHEALLKFTKKSEANSNIKAALDIASSLEGIVTPIAELDANKELLNMPNGTFHLGSLTWRGHRSSDLLTSVTNARLRKDARADRWLQFISEVTRGDTANESYLQKICGYLLSADNSEQTIFFLIGDGGDGKSVFIETIKYVLGDYQTTLAASSISSSNKNSIPNDIAKLRGKKLVTISELPKDLHLDTQLVKGISGGDTLTARFLHQEYFDFEPQAQMLIATNFYPYADPDDKAYFRRVKIMRFPVCFTNDQPDIHLTSKLKSEADGILAWMIDGLRGYLDEGLLDTPAMLSEKYQYQRFVNPISTFFDEYLQITDIRDFVLSDHMDEHFQEFLRREEKNFIKVADLRRFLEQKGFERKQKRIGTERFRGYVGLKLVHFKDNEIPF